MQLFVRALNSNTLCIKADTVDELKQRLQEREGIPAGYQRLLYGSRQLADGQPLSDFNLEADATVHLVLRLRGGKGGFGALLRAGGKAALTDNFDACRDLSGRRLRHANAEQKLAEWSAEARKRELEKQAKKALKEQEKQARREERSQVDMDDVRVQQSQALAAVQMAVHSSVAASPPKRKSGDGGAAPSKKAKFYAVADDVSSSDLSDSDEEDEVSGDSRLPSSDSGTSAQEPLSATVETASASAVDTAAAAAAAAANAGSSAGPSAAAAKTMAGKPSAAPTANAPAVDASVHASSSHSAQSAPATAAGAQLADAGPVDLSQVSSAAELEALGLDALKRELQRHGLKCGGSLSERAARLFLLKDMPLEQLDKKLFAKPVKS